jgi:hypothetical protein
VKGDDVEFGRRGIVGQIPRTRLGEPDVLSSLGAFLAQARLARRRGAVTGLDASKSLLYPCVEQD